ncbi:MAG: glyoxalase superfamily protein [Lentilitoribacter sp.]
MNSLEDAKAQADKLSSILKELGYNVSRGHALETVARLSGYKDWNCLSAKLHNIHELHPLPDGWQMSGSDVDFYEYGLVPDQKHTGVHPMVIRKKKDTPMLGDGFATFMQSCEIGEYRGKRVRFKGDIRAENCEGAVTIWLRADGNIPGQYVAFANMETRAEDGPLRGTTGWTEREIVLDIPQSAESLHYGYYLRGDGAGYGCNFVLEIAEEHAVLTDGQSKPLKKPFNLKFSS